MKKLLLAAVLAAFAAPAHAEMSNLEIASYGLDAADAATTCIGIAQGGTEGNILLRAVIGKRPKCWKVVAAKAALAGGRYFALRGMNEGDRRTALWISVGIASITVTWNFSQLRK